MSAENEINERGEAPSLGTPSVPFSEMLDKVLSNPQIISTVAAALSSAGVGEAASVSPQSEKAIPHGESKEVSSVIPDNFAEKLPEIMNMLKPMLAASSSDKNISTDKRACLLNAMKPYVSKQRCEAIDYIIKISRLSELLKYRQE